MLFFPLRGPSVNQAWDYCHGGIVKIECVGSQQRLTQTNRERHPALDSSIKTKILLL